MATNAFDGLELPVYGDGRQIREWLHVSDHCAAVEHVLHEGAPGEVYNVAGEDHENLDVVGRIVEATGCDAGLVRHVEDRPGHDRRYALDDSKLRGLGWSPLRFGSSRASPTPSRGIATTAAWWEPIKSGAFRAYYEEQYALRLASE